MSKLENKAPFPNVQGTGTYPEGDGLQAQIQTRHRWGFFWRIAFIFALMIAIVSLVALLYTIVNDAFGYVVIVNRVDPERLTLNVLEDKLLSAPNTASSEDDHELAAGISDNPDGIGFFGYAYYQENTDGLQIVAVDGQEAGGVAEDYPLVRPLYLYSSAPVLEENQAANLFLNYLLTNVNGQMDEIGYLPVDAASQAVAQQNWLSANPDLGLSPGQWAAIDPDGLAGNVRITGSSTVFPLTEHMLEQ
jgi:hypothetical protein